MINLHNELEKFPPIDLARLKSKGGDIPDNVNDAIILYNKALESLHTRSEDIAIISLKKAIALYGEFNEAMNLLGVC